MDRPLTTGILDSEEAVYGAATSRKARIWGTVAVVFVLIGLSGLASLLGPLWALWTTDPLRSFGMLLPLASACLGIRQFKATDWQNKGNWWGFALMASVAVLSSITADATQKAQITFLLGNHVMPLRLLPTGVLLWGYFAGAVLLFGGGQAFRRHSFALALLLFVNPVPLMFTTLADLPLQAFGAKIARDFAHWLAVPVEGDTLKLMFSPQLGMFVAPGCDGLRGAVALGYLALIIGHLKGMKRAAWAIFVIGALLLAYTFNLLRLCGVIGYYWLALRIPIIGGYGTEADYVIGGLLFFCAAFFLFATPRLLQSRL